MIISAILIFLMGDPPRDAGTLPNLSFSFFNSRNGQKIEATDGWIISPRNQAIDFHVLLEVESVEARYEHLIFRDSSVPDPLLVGSRRRQNLWITAFRLAESGKRDEVPILTHCSGGGKNHRVYESTISLRILYSESERMKRFEAMIDRILSESVRPRQEDEEAVARTREMFRRQAYQYAVDMPPGDYELEARYDPNVDESWKGTLIAKAKIRVTEENDPLKKPLDAKQDK